MTAHRNRWKLHSLKRYNCRPRGIGPAAVLTGSLLLACCLVLILAAAGQLSPPRKLIGSGQAATGRAVSASRHADAAPLPAAGVPAPAGRFTEAEFARPKRRPGPETPLSDWSNYTFTQIHMAMPVRITVWSQDERQARVAGRAAFHRISELVQVFSTYEPDSELNRLLPRGGVDVLGRPCQVSPDLLAVLLSSQRFFQLTQGAFDPSAGPLIELWKQARKAKQLPSQARIDLALDRVGFDQIAIDAKKEEVLILRPDLQLDLGAIAKGYLADQALETLRESGIHSACIEAGGDFVVGESPPQTSGWEIEVPGLGGMRLSHCGISISGDTVQFAEIDSRRYSHVLDPRTGIPLTNRIMAVVIAPRAIESDALATSACILEAAEIERIVDSLPDVRFWRWQVDAKGAKIPPGNP